MVLRFIYYVMTGTFIMDSALVIFLFGCILYLVRRIITIILDSDLNTNILPSGSQGAIGKIQFGPGGSQLGLGGAQVGASTQSTQVEASMQIGANVQSTLLKAANPTLILGGPNRGYKIIGDIKHPPVLNRDGTVNMEMSGSTINQGYTDAQISDLNHQFSKQSIKNII